MNQGKISILESGKVLANAKEFFSWVEEIRELEAAGELKQIDGNCLTSELLGTFPVDVINMLFLNEKRNQHYFLACDAYHGGGVWECVTDKDQFDSIQLSIQSLGSVFTRK